MLLETNVIEGAYLQDTLEQPSALGRMWTDLAADFASGKCARIVLTGMGSSLFISEQPSALGRTWTDLVVNIAWGKDARIVLTDIVSLLFALDPLHLLENRRQIDCFLKQT